MSIDTKVLRGMAIAQDNNSKPITAAALRDVADEVDKLHEDEKQTQADLDNCEQWGKKYRAEIETKWKPLLEAANTVTEADPLPWAKLKKAIAACESRL